jgi:hypothetical protein
MRLPLLSCGGEFLTHFFPSVQRKVLYETAAKVYNLPLPV